MLTNMVKALTIADTMSKMPNTHDVAAEVASWEDIDTEWSPKLLIDTDDISSYTKQISDGQHIHTMSATIANNK